MAVNALEEVERVKAALADVERKIERLKFHAEAMAGIVEEYWNGSENERAMSDALAEMGNRIAPYRAEFKEE